VTESFAEMDEGGNLKLPLELTGALGLAPGTRVKVRQCGDRLIHHRPAGPSSGWAPDGSWRREHADFRDDTMPGGGLLGADARYPRAAGRHPANGLDKPDRPRDSAGVHQ
jgi:hypothetical protein